MGFAIELHRLLIEFHQLFVRSHREVFSIKSIEHLFNL